MEYPIGTEYMTRGKYPRKCKVIDIYKTYNSKNELVKVYYVSTHEFMGQIVTDHQVPTASIAMGLIK